MTTTITTNTPSLADEMQQARADRIERERKITRQDQPRASSIGECAREVFYQITEWRMRPPHPHELLERFAMGRNIEKIVRRELIDEGHELVEGQLPFEIREDLALTADSRYVFPNEIICTGHLDGRIEWNGQKPVCEIKSLHPNIWSRINSLEDFTRMGSFWARYPHQLLLYCYSQSEPIGLYILSDCMGHVKFIEVRLEDHLDLCEKALQIAKTAKLAVLTGTPPPFHPDPGVCRNCWARQAGVCFPPIDDRDRNLLIMDDDILIADLERMHELREDAEEFNTLERRLKNRFKATGVGMYVAGNTLVTCTTKPWKGYDIPDDVKAKYAKMGERFFTTWERLEPDNKEQTNG